VRKLGLYAPRCRLISLLLSLKSAIYPIDLAIGFLSKSPATIRERVHSN
jgi:hypothetical protein